MNNLQIRFVAVFFFLVFTSYLIEHLSMETSTMQAWHGKIVGICEGAGLVSACIFLFRSTYFKGIKKHQNLIMMLHVLAGVAWVIMTITFAVKDIF